MRLRIQSCYVTFHPFDPPGCTLPEAVAIIVNSDLFADPPLFSLFIDRKCKMYIVSTCYKDVHQAIRFVSIISSSSITWNTLDYNI